MVKSSGAYDELIDIERAAAVRDDTGGAAKPVWSKISENVFAAVQRPRNRNESREVASGAAVREERICVFTVRHPEDVTSADRIIWDGDAYAVEGVVTDKRAGEIQITGIFRAGTDAR